MTIDERAMIEALEQLALHADVPPPELSVTVRRRAAARAKRQAWTTVVAALAVVATVATFATTVGRGGPTQGAGPGPTRSGWRTGDDGFDGLITYPPFPTAPVGSTLPWHVPSLNADLPSAESIWPGEIVHLPKAPDGRRPTLDANIDRTHVLVETGPGRPEAATYWSYDTTLGTFRRIADSPVSGGTEGSLAVSAHWLVFSVVDGDTQQVYKAPLDGSGGSTAQFVGTISLPNGTGPWFATDTTLYFSGQKPGVMAMPLSGGTSSAGTEPAPIPGFEDMMVVRDSPWAALVAYPVTTHGYNLAYFTQGPPPVLYRTGITRELKNVVTGQDLEAYPPPRTIAMSCVPTFCLGTRDDGDVWNEFIQRPDGTDLRMLDGGDQRTLVSTTDGDGLILVIGPTVRIVDPVRGLAGTATGPSARAGTWFPTNRSNDAVGWPSTDPQVIDTYLVLRRIP